MERPEDDHLDVGTRRTGDSVVVELRLDRPEAMNALRTGTIAALARTVASLDRASGDVVELSGAGEDFCVGADMHELVELDTDATVETIEELQDLIVALRSCPLAVVARVDGLALGAGFLLCQAADIVVASEQARFGVQEVQVGLPAAGYATVLLPRIVGERRAREWLLLGERVAAKEAGRAGFVSEVVHVSELNRAVEEHLTTLGGNDGVAVEQIKRLLAGDDRPDHAEREMAAVRKAIEEGCVDERLEAFLER
jgi:enoyl-CoA hydratase/carnithine racemase